MAGNLRSLAFLTSFSSWAAPSSRLYSECTCRWTNSACCTTGRLLELDGGGGLVRDVVEHGVDTRQPPQRPRQLRHHGHPPPCKIRRHSVARVHPPGHHRPSPGRAPQRQHCHPPLPGRVVKPPGPPE